MEKIPGDELLFIDDELEPKISLNEAEALKPIQKEFMESYFKNRDRMPIEEWLKMEISESLPEYGDKEITLICDEIIATLKIQEEKKASLRNAIESGRSKESWFASEAKNALSLKGAKEASQYLENLDKALASTNESLYRTLHTQAGVGSINQNPHLDGFIAEQYHAQTFNLKAEATGSPYRAKVLEPAGKGYAKNSVDIEIVDGNGHIVRRYQSKYCKDAEATARAFKSGDYRGQQKLVPDGQEMGIASKVTTFIEAPDGTASNPLTKERAKELQNEAQSGNWSELNWNEYQVKDLALGIGKQAGHAALMGAAVGIGVDVAQKVWNGEEIDSGQLVEAAISSGTDFGVKAATAGALKVGAEKGFIKAIPKGTPAGTLANVAFVAVENIKIVGKVATGDLTIREGFEKIEQTTVAAVAGITVSAKGAAVGAAIGCAFGPVGVAAGGLVGGAVGYMAGSKVGETIVKGGQKIRKRVKEVVDNVVDSVGNAVSSIGSSVVEGISSLCSALGGIFSW